MPEICRFLGAIIAMYHREHGVSHFHVTYADYDATIAIETGKVLAGHLPRRVLRRIQGWRKVQIDELLENARLAAERKPLNKIAAPE